MKKKFFLCALLVILAVSFAVPAFAGSSRLIDGADLITPVEEDYLLNRLNAVSDRYNLDVVIVTVPSLNGYDAQAYADDLFDYGDYRADGILLMVSIQDRYWAISTTGYGITAFTDAGLAYLEDQFLEDLSEGNYADAFTTFTVVCEDMLIQAQTGRPYDVGNMPKEPFRAGMSLLISLIIGLVAALITTGIMAAKLKSVRPRGSAANYVREGSMELTQCMDLYLYRTVNRVKRDTGSGSGGSSVHRGSSGVSHGGRSGRF